MRWSMRRRGLKFFDFRETPSDTKPVEAGVSRQLKIMLVIDCCILKAGFVLVEETEFAVGKCILWAAINRGKEGLFRLRLVFSERYLTLGSFQQRFLLFLLGHLQDLFALLILAVGSEFVRRRNSRFGSERSIGVAKQYLILWVARECADEPGGAGHCGARTAALNVGVDIENDGRRDSVDVVHFEPNSRARRSVRIGKGKGFLSPFCQIRMIVVEGRAGLILEGSVLVEQFESDRHGVWIVTGNGHGCEPVVVGLALHFA